MSALQTLWLVSQLLSVAHCSACVIIKDTTDGTIVLGGIPTVSILMCCVIKVYNVTENTMVDYQQRDSMLRYSRFLETLGKKKNKFELFIMQSLQYAL